MTTLELDQVNYGMDAAIGEIVHAPNINEANDSFWDIVDTLDHSDLQAKRIIVHGHMRDMIMSQFTERPDVSVLGELHVLGQIHEPRTITPQVIGYGLQTDAFITRSADTKKIDTQYRSAVLPDGGHRVRVDSLLRGQLEVPCTIIASSGSLQVSEREYRRGAYHDVVYEVGSHPRADVLLRAFFATTLLASHMALNRNPEDSQVAHASAHNLLEDYLRHTADC